MEARSEERPADKAVVGAARPIGVFDRVVTADEAQVVDPGGGGVEGVRDLENLALRQQLAVYKKTLSRPRLHQSDRLFWVCLLRVWAEWRQALLIVTPDTVLRWHRRRFAITGPSSP